MFVISKQNQDRIGHKKIVVQPENLQNVVK